MDNLYKKFRKDEVLYLVILEHGNGITCINEQKMQLNTFNFNSDEDLTDFMKKYEVKR
jgi:hypothetical protein